MKFPIALLAALLAAAPALAQTAEPPTLAQLVADGMRPQLPRQLEGGLKMTAVRAEGPLLVVGVEDPDNAAGAMPPEQMARQMAEGIAIGFCSDKAVAEKMLSTGFAIRADLRLVDGREVSSEIVDRCPD